MVSTLGAPVVAFLLFVAAPSHACGAGECGISDGIYSCFGYWPEPYEGTCSGQPLLCANSSSADPAASNLLIAPVACSPCMGALPRAPCQTQRTTQWRSTAEVNGICMPGGVCVSCGSFKDQVSCNSENSTVCSSMCSWEGGECRISPAPGVAERGFNTVWPANKGGAPFDMWSDGTIDNNCGIAGSCGRGIDGEVVNRDRCEKTHGCSWNRTEATCGGCSCQCDGCLSHPDASGQQTCGPTDYNTAAQCDAAKGTWCACNAPSSCANAHTAATCIANAAPETSTTTGACTWDPKLPVNMLQGQELGSCVECSAHSHCTTGNCEAVLVDDIKAEHIGSSCGACTNESHCNGHGSAAHEGSGECRCSCEPGWKGDQCEIADCSIGAIGEHCQVCQEAACKSTGWPLKLVLGSAGSDSTCACTANDGLDTCTTDGRCGSRPLKCGEGDIKSCGPGGQVMGDDFRKLCYCQCSPSRFGTYCTETAPTSLTCGAGLGCDNSPRPQGCACTHTWDCVSGDICAGSPATCQPSNADRAAAKQTFTLVVTSHNDVAVDLRLCNQSKCAGEQYQRCSTAHAINTYGPKPGPVYFTGMIPPRETVQFQLPTDTVYAVFVDGACGDDAAELYPPKGGWPSTLNYDLTAMCASIPHAPNSCNFFNCGTQHHNWFTNGYYGGDAAPVCSNVLRPTIPTTRPLPDSVTAPIVPCNQTTCCCDAKHMRYEGECDPFYF